MQIFFPAGLSFCTFGFDCGGDGPEEAQVERPARLIDRQRVDRAFFFQHFVGVGQVFQIVAARVELLHPFLIADVDHVVGRGFGSFAVDGDVAAWPQ